MEFITLIGKVNGLLITNIMWEKVARLGFDILEIGVGPIADYSQTEIKELRKCADDNGIILTGGYGPTFNHNMGSSDPKIKAEALDWYKRTFDVMGELDMHWLGGALYSYWPVDFSTVNKPEDWKYSVEGVRELADAANHMELILEWKLLTDLRRTF